MAVRKREAVPEAEGFLDGLPAWRAVRAVRGMLLATDPPHPLEAALAAEAQRLDVLGLGWARQLDALILWCDARGLGDAARMAAARGMGRER